MKLRNMLDFLREQEIMPFSEVEREGMTESFQTVIPPSEGVPDPASMVSGCLYLAGGSQGPCMILVSGSGEKREVRRMMLPEGTDLGTLEAIIRETLLIERKRAEITDRILEELCDGQDLQKIIDTASRICGNSILVNDISYTIIAKSYQEKGSEEILEDSNVYSLIGDDAISKMQSLGIFKRIRHMEGPMVSRHPSTQQEWLFESVRIYRVPVADIAILADHRALSYTDFMVMDILTRIVAIQLQKDEFFSRNQDAAYGIFIRDLINGSLNDPVGLEMRAKTLGIRFYGKCCLAVVRPVSGNQSAHELARLRSQMAQMMPEARWTVLDDMIAALFSEPGDHAMTKHQQDRLSRFAEENRLSIGISDTFMDPLCIPAYYTQAREAVLASLPNSPGYGMRFFSDILMNLMIEGISGRMDRRALLYSPLLMLEAYDREHDSELMNTLKQYLLTSQNTGLTAIALHIHRNTLLYRINRIMEITGMNLDQVSERIRAFLHFIVREYEQIS